MKRVAIGLITLAAIACAQGSGDKRTRVSRVVLRDAFGRCVEIYGGKYTSFVIIDDKHCTTVIEANP